MPDESALRIAAEPSQTTPRRAAGLTVEDVARRYRVSPDKVRGWIGRGELRAINTSAALCGRPRWIITPESLADFEKARRGGPGPKAPPRRRRRAGEQDFYPD